MSTKHSAFTIVELLVVIIVIAVLVTLSIVGYSGISTKANVSALQSDLSNAKKQLLAFQASSSTNAFPTAINCASPSATEICIRPSSSSAVFSYAVYNSTAPSFYLMLTNGDVSYVITEVGSPAAKTSLVSDGLVLNLDGGNTASYPGSGTTWYDLGLGGTNGTLMNGVGYTTTSVGGLVFDGVDDYVVANNVNNYYAETVIVWVKSNTPKWSTTGWVSSSRSTNGHIIHPIFNTNTVEFYLYDSAASYTHIGSCTPAAVDSAHMYAITTNGSNLHTIYFDGGFVLKNGNTISRSITAAPRSLYIGSDSLYGGRYGSGNVYNVTKYSRSLSASEISQNFNAIRGRYSI